MMTGKNIGDLLSGKNVTWGWFEGGFDNPKQTHIGANGQPKADYIPHHQPFQYYPQTANPKHNLPTPGVPIGAADPLPKGANHQYDLIDFWNALAAHQLPSVSYLKAPGYQDGRPGSRLPWRETHLAPVARWCAYLGGGGNHRVEAGLKDVYPRPQRKLAKGRTAK
jgi:phospholipase C